MQSILNFLEWRWPRLIALLAAMLAAANLFFPLEWSAASVSDVFKQLGDIGAGRWSAFILTFGAFLAGQIKSDWFKFAPSAHDIGLAKKILATVGLPETRFLREQDFGAPIRANSISFLDDLGDWRGVHFEFENKDVQRKFSPLLKSLQDLRADIAAYAGPFPNTNNFDILTIENEQDRQLGELTPLTLKRMNELNNSAETILEKYEEFVKLLQKRIPQAFAS